MEVRCSKCNKLFRVSDDKIIGSGIKFGCTRCGQRVTITRDDFEQYVLSKSAVPAFASFEPKPAKAELKPAKPLHEASAGVSLAAQLPDFGLNEEEDAGGSSSENNDFPFGSPEISEPVTARGGEAGAKASPELKAESSLQTAQEPQVEVPAEPKAKSLPVRASSPFPGVSHAPGVIDASPLHSANSSGAGKKIAIFFVVLLAVGGAAFLGYRFYPGLPAPATNAVSRLISSEGLQVLNPSGSVDAATGNLIVTGTVENTTSTPKPAWYLVVDVYNAQGTVVAKAKMVSGKQLFTRRDFGILEKRAVNVQDLKMKSLREQGIIIPPKSSVDFEIIILEPPVGIASFNAVLQPFDPVQLFKELAEDQK